MLRLLLIALAATFAGAAPARREPVATITTAGAIGVLLSPDVLHAAEVRKQLTSGLTTAFVLTATASGNSGAARIEVRYELWDERYLVSTIDSTGRLQKLTFGSAERMAQWWSDTSFLIVAGGVPAAEARVQLRLRVVPFSAREEADTKRWLRRALDPDRNGNGPRSEGNTTGLLDLIVGTSIQQKPILEYRWSVIAKRETPR
jgi:hypothetical protein